MMLHSLKKRLFSAVVVVAGLALVAGIVPLARSQSGNFPIPHPNLFGVPGFIQGHHADGYLDPLANGCTACHGATLHGELGFAPSCFSCHGAFWDPALPDYPDSHTDVKHGFHHGVDKKHPYESGCTECHGPALDGVLGIAPSCYTCHGKKWHTPSNIAPFAVADGPYAALAGEPITFDGTLSLDVDGNIVSYDWDFGDGTVGTGATPTHTYAAPGAYTVTLLVTDNEGAADTDTTIAEIGAPQNQPPVADPNGPYAAEVGQLITFDGSGSTDPDGTIVAYDWDFGDGTTGSGMSPTHSYAAAGTYTVTLTVTDDGGATASAATTVDVAAGEVWAVQVPYVESSFTLTLEPSNHIFLAWESFADGTLIFGVGIRSGGVVFWIDTEGAVFYGMEDPAAGTMQGIVIHYFGASSIWFAQRQL